MDNWALFGPRQTYTRPTFLSRARSLVQNEQTMRTRHGGTLGGFQFRSGGDISRAAENWPLGYAGAHGGRGVAEVRRDMFINQLRSLRGAPPVAPSYTPGLMERMQSWGSGVVNRANERSFWDTRRATPGGWR